MGYRSEVAIALTDPAVRLLNAIMEHEPEIRSLIGDSQQTINTSEEDRGGKLYWDYIKWYEDFQEISMIHRLLEFIPDEDFHFIRIGEDSTDIEERGCFYDSDMSVQRSISW